MEKDQTSKQNDNDSDSISDKTSQPVNSLESVQNERIHVLHKMYVSNVGNRLREMDVPSDVDCQRWAWELMQNAKDSIATPDKYIKKTKVDIKLFLENDKVVFKHNGLPFNGKAYLALLYKYSDGKANNAESTGRFGTGFLTTHSLSKVVKVEGDIFNIHDEYKLKDFNGTIFDLGDNIAGFEVTMYRDGSTPEELIQGIERMEKEKKFYIGKPSGWTTYTYILTTKRNHESSELGFENFKDNIAQTMLFNNKFGNVQLTYKNGYTTTIKHLSSIPFENVSITTFELQNENTWQRKFIISSVFEHSNELTERFKQDRNLRLQACIELTENNELVYYTKSPCLFCSLPLVGSESHEMPITLNSDDFEPNTERQGILLDGPDKKQDMDCLSDVGINRLILRRSIPVFESIVKHCSEQRYKNLHVLTRGLKNIPKVESDFDPKWFKQNVMIPMRSVLMKYPIVFTDDDDGLKKIEDVFIPIYPFGKNDDYKRQYHHFTNIFFGSVPRFEESIEWSNGIWNENLNNLVDIERLLNAFKTKNCDDETKNSFIRFAWENHQELLKTIPVLINQKNDYVLLTDDFADGSEVKEDAVDLMEELDIKWRVNHLNRSITSIQLGLSHTHEFAIGEIRKNENPMKKYILSRYILENNEKRVKMFKFAQEFFPNKFVKNGQKLDCYVASSLDEDLWDKSDNDLFKDMISIIEDSKKLGNIKISDFIEFIEFVRNFNIDPNVFDQHSIIPAKSGFLHRLNQLSEEKGIPEFLLIEAQKHLGYDISDQMKDPSFSCVTAPKEFSVINFMTSINKKLADDGSISDDKKLKMSLSILSFLPEEESEQRSNQIHIQDAAKALQLQILPDKTISNQPKLFWDESNSIVIHEIEKMIQNCKTMFQFKNKFNLDIDQYLNQFIDLFDKRKAKIVPNQNGNLCLLSDLSEDVNIPELVKEIFIVLNNDLKPQLKLNTVNIECPDKKTIDSIIGKMNDFLEKANKDTKKKAASMIIDISPSDPSVIPQQVNIQNLYHNLTKTNPQISTIDCKNKGFWIDANNIIIKYCETLISKSGNLKNLCNNTGIDENQYIEILNNFQSILDVNQNAIIPNYYGIFKKKTELYILKQPEGIFKAIKNYLKKDLFEIFIDKRVNIEVTEYSIFESAKIVNNNFDRADYNNRLNLSKEIISFIPNDDQISKDLKNLLNIVNTFDRSKKEEIEVEICEGLYSRVKPMIIEYINQKIANCRTLKSLSDFYNNPIDFLNENAKILDFNKYKIIPDQEGSFHFIYELKQDDGIYKELKDILHNHINLYKILVHNDIKNVRASQSLTNDSVLKYINENAKFQDVAFQMLQIVPENNEDKEQQLKILYLFTHFMKIETTEIPLNLPLHFWNETNKVVLFHIIQLLQKKKNLSEISNDEDEAIQILKTLYEFVSPSKANFKNINMIPNQLGELLCFNDLYNEQEEIPDEFKDVLKEHFSLDIRKTLQHSKLSINLSQSLSVNSSVITNAINSGFSSDKNIYRSTSLKITKNNDERSKAFILFQPTGENTKVHKFIHCYKSLLNYDYEPITLLTSNQNLWDIAIETLTKLIIKQLTYDKNLKTTAKRIGKNENEVVDFLNLFYEFAPRHPIYPNMLGEFHESSEVFTPEGIDETILDIMAFLAPELDFRKKLVHEGINGIFAKKKIDEIAVAVDNEIKAIMKDEKRRNNENTIKGCKLLIMKWLKNNSDKKKFFLFTENFKMNIILEIIVEPDKREKWKEMLAKDPAKILDIMMGPDEDDEKPDPIKRMNETDQQYLQNHPEMFELFVQNQRQKEERLRQQQIEAERMRQRQRELEQIRLDRERRYREMVTLNSQRSFPVNRNYHRTRNTNIRNFVNVQPVFHMPAPAPAPAPPRPRPFLERLRNSLESLLRTLFKRVKYNENPECYYCSLVDNDEADEYLIIPLFADSNNEIDLNEHIIEIATDFQDTSIIFIVPSQNNFNENNFNDSIKILTNIGFDLNDLKIVESIGEIVSIDTDDFSFKGCNQYFIHVKNNYIENNMKGFDEWKDSFTSTNE